MHPTQNILSQLLDVVPELKEGYETITGHSVHSTKAPYKPGITIVFEDLLVPFIAALSSDITRSDRLADVMNWIEQLANSEIPEVRNLVAVGVCEALITNEDKHLQKIQPYMGKKTRGLCRSLFPLYHVSENTAKLLEDE